MSYTGWRLSLFNLILKKSDKNKLELQFDLANTGRFALHPNESGVEQQRRLLIEFDTLNLDPRLLPHLRQISEQLRHSNLAAPVGTIVRAQGLTLYLATENPAQESPAFIRPDACPDLRIDSLVLLKKEEKAIVFRLLLRNAGAVPAVFGNIPFPNYIVVYQSASPIPGRSAIGITPVGIQPELRELQAGADTWCELRLEGLTLNTFQPWLIFQLDPMALLPECERGNNMRAYLSE